MAAGVTYFAFLGLFPVSCWPPRSSGWCSPVDALLQQQLYDAIREAFPGELGEQLVARGDRAIGSAGVTGLIGARRLPVRGPADHRQAADRDGADLEGRTSTSRTSSATTCRTCVALVVLGGIGLVSLGLTGAVTQATSWVLEPARAGRRARLRRCSPGWSASAWPSSSTSSIFLWLLRVVPSVSHPLRGCSPGALFGAAGLEVLKLIGGFYLSLISDSVTASAFGGAVGLLVWINLVARFAFFTAAWTATLRSDRGGVAVPGWTPTPVAA